MKVNWKMYDHLIGVIKDTEVAKLCGCYAATVQRRRLKLKRPPVVRKMWSEADELLFQDGYIICVDCGNKKTISEFSKNKTATNGYRKQCVLCHDEIRRKRTQKYKRYWVERMGGQCNQCGFSTHLSALQFHHVHGEDKAFGPTAIMYSDQSKNRHLIIAELDKCCLLCANCHDAYHANELSLQFMKAEFGWKITPRGQTCPQRNPIEDEGVTYRFAGNKIGV